MSAHHFQRVSATFDKSGECPVCEKRVRRSRTYSQTVNPFNRNEDGTVKTSYEVWLAVRAEGEAWQPDFTHERCIR